MIDPLPAGEDSLSLLNRARLGDLDALNRLMERYRRRLAVWAHGRVPRHARSLNDTDDLVQDTLIRICRNLDSFVPTREGSLVAYMRQALWNRIRDEFRRSRVRGGAVPVGSDDIADAAPSPLDALLGAERVARYEAALSGIEPDLREAIIARFELHYSFADLARLLHKPTADAARKHVERAVDALRRQINSRVPVTR